MKTNLFSLILLLLIHCNLLAQTAHIPYKDSQQVNRLEREQWADMQFPRPAVIVFHANSCLYCREFEPIVEEVARKFKYKVDFYYTVDEKFEWLLELGGDSIPFILFVYGTTPDGKPLYTMAKGKLKEQDLIGRVAIIIRDWSPNTPINEKFIGTWVGNNKYGPVKLIISPNMCMRVEYNTQYSTKKLSKQLYCEEESVRKDRILLSDTGTYTLTDYKCYPSKDYPGHYHMGIKESLEGDYLLVKDYSGFTFHIANMDEDKNRINELVHEYMETHNPYRVFTNIYLRREQ